MHHRIGGLQGFCGLLIAAIAALALSACGSSSSNSGNASSLLKQTFTGSHSVNSGNLNFTLTIDPSGSSSLTEPVTLSFGGPFQSTGSGKLPKSNFDISVSAQGKTGSLAILSTGTAGYVTLQGTSYQLPATTFKQLESSFASLGTSATGSSSSGSGTLSKLGIDPLNWLVSPSVVGTESVGGTSTTHIRASVNVTGLLADLNTFLQKASSLGVSGANQIPKSISAATRSTIASEVRSPSFDVWTGKSDKTVRKLQIGLTLPVTGQLSTALGGLSSARIGVTMQYADLNEPQTITAPTNIRPYSEFATKMQSFLSAIQGSVSGATSGSSTSTTGVTGTTGAGTSTGVTGTTGAGTSTGAAGTTGTAGATSTTGGTSASSQATKYGQCLAAAHNDISKMQKCAALINGG